MIITFSLMLDGGIHMKKQLYKNCSLYNIYDINREDFTEK